MNLNLTTDSKLRTPAATRFTQYTTMAEQLLYSDPSVKSFHSGKSASSPLHGGRRSFPQERTAVLALWQLLESLCRAILWFSAKFRSQSSTKRTLLKKAWSTLRMTVMQRRLYSIQWLLTPRKSFVLFCLCVCFVLPGVCWDVLSGRMGIGFKRYKRCDRNASLTSHRRSATTHHWWRWNPFNNTNGEGGETPICASL